MLSDELTLQLIKPVTLGKGDGAITYTELNLREPTAGEIEKAARADTNVGAAITLISLVAKMPRAAVERLCQRDMKAANDFLGSFATFGDTTPTGGDDSLPD